MYAITPRDVEREARADGLTVEELRVPDTVLLTFNRPVVEELTNLCALNKWDWKISKYSPYSPVRRTWRGTYDNHDIAVFVPPMGASPLASVCEELIHFGGKVIFLLCACWSFGDTYLKKGQILLPEFAAGFDGTSRHYNNKQGLVRAEPQVIQALAGALNELEADWKRGGIGCCEALYRINRTMVQSYIDQGCHAMENGEVAVLYSLAQQFNVRAGVLLQPYIDLSKGWDTSYMDKTYAQTCRTQAKAAVKAALQILPPPADGGGVRWGCSE